MNKEEIIARANDILIASQEIQSDIEIIMSPKDMKGIDILNLLTRIVRSGESAFAGFSGAGEDKAEVVKEIWKTLDEKYRLVDKLDAAIKLPGYLEPFDGMAIRRGMDMLIKAIVTALNQVGWFKH